MRTFHWLFVATVTLVLGGIVMAQQPASKPAAPAGQQAASTPATARRAAPSTPRPVVNVNEVMHAIIEPASTVVFDAVATTIDASGVHEKYPQNDEEWDAVLHAAITLTEAGNLLMIPGRKREVGGAIPAKNWADWNRKAREMIEASEVALKAARNKSVQGLLDAGERIDVACDACHEPYQIVPEEPPKQ